MDKFLILLAGPPATGKSFLVNTIKSNFPNTFVISPDEFKQDLAENVGFSNLKEKENLEILVWKCYYSALDIYMTVGKRLIVTEYPFSYKQKNKLESLAKNHGYQIITIRLVADFDILWQRRIKRDLDDSRHLSFIMTHYKFGDTLPDRRKADNLITKEEFKEIIETRKYNEFSLGTLIEIDVTDFSKVDYQFLVEMIKRLL